MGDVDYHEEIATFDANAANEESRILWLKIGRACAEWAEGGLECLEEPEWADRCMSFAMRAEACFWRASGDANAFDVENIHPQFAARQPKDTPQ